MKIRTAAFVAAAALASPPALAQTLYGLVDLGFRFRIDAARRPTG